MTFEIGPDGSVDPFAAKALNSYKTQKQGELSFKKVHQRRTLVLKRHRATPSTSFVKLLSRAAITCMAALRINFRLLTVSVGTLARQVENVAGSPASTCRLIPR